MNRFYDELSRISNLEDFSATKAVTDSIKTEFSSDWEAFAFRTSGELLAAR